MPLTRLKASARAAPTPGRHFNLTVDLFNCFCFLAKQPTCPCDIRDLRGSHAPTVKVAGRRGEKGKDRDIRSRGKTTYLSGAAGEEQS